MKLSGVQLLAAAAILFAGPMLLGQTTELQETDRAAAKVTLDADRLLELVDAYELDAASASCATTGAGANVTFDAAFYDRCIEIARELSPELGGQLAELRGSNPKQFEHNLRVHGRTLVSLAQLAEIHPNLFKLRLGLMQVDQRTNEVASEFRSALSNPERERLGLLEQKLRAHVTVQVDLSFKVREEQLCQLRDHVQRLESELEADQKRADQIVEQRILQMLDRQSLQNYQVYKASTSPEHAAMVQRYIERQRRVNKEEFPPE
jgi:hypothetical protein